MFAWVSFQYFQLKSSKKWKKHLSKNDQGGYRGESQSKCDEQEGTSFGQSYHE